MKKIITTGLMLAVALFGSVALAKGKSGKDAGASDIEVLHWPTNNEDFFLVIPMNALAGHLRHGDCLPDGIPRNGGGGDDEAGGDDDAGGDDGVGDDYSEDAEAILAAIAKAGADIAWVDGCLLDDEDEDDPEVE